ncbi:glycosyltransferase family 2 protein [Flagellimonas ochracea]|nr:glycosyltransferase family 2 protein [Allomuricauda ochracea]
MAIKCYMDQTYPNKELVIVTDGTDWFKRAVADYIKHLERDDIRLISLEQKDYKLGQLRNISISEAQGDIICQWDDDDLYHPKRLQVQFEQMAADKADASFFTDQLQYWWEDRVLNWVDWTKDSHMGPWQLIPGTVMMYKNTDFSYPEDGIYARIGEDSALLDSMVQHLKISRLSKYGYLYMYTYHGRNTFSREHHGRISKLYGRNLGLLEQFDDSIWKHLTYYPIARPVRFNILSHIQ